MQKKIYKARYSEIAKTLINQITSGHYELGQQLPSEQAMSESFNVSRFTIRAALREIEKMGMISRHRRRGTILLSDKPVELIVQEIKGFEELFQYPQDTVLHMTKSSSTEADISLANFLKTTPGTEWTRLEGLRVTQDKSPFCITEIYVPKEINLSLLIGISMILNMIVAGLFGILVPVSLKKFNIDPALASSVFVTTITDVIGFLSFLGLGSFYFLN